MGKSTVLCALQLFPRLYAEDQAVASTGRTAQVGASSRRHRGVGLRLQQAVRPTGRHCRRRYGPSRPQHARRHRQASGKFDRLSKLLQIVAAMDASLYVAFSNHTILRTVVRMTGLVIQKTYNVAVVDFRECVSTRARRIQQWRFVIVALLKSAYKRHHIDSSPLQTLSGLVQCTC